GDLDVVTGNSDVRVLVNLGQQGWGGPVVFPQTWSVGAVTHADLDQDGRPDLIATFPWEYGIGVMMNTGGGAFGPAHFLSAGHAPALVCTSDVDGDRYPDLLVTN